MPSNAQLNTALARATTLAELADFDAMMSVLEEAAKKFQIAIGEAIHFASCHLQGKRKLGCALLQVTNHGGDRSSSQRAKGADDPLARRIDKDRRCRYKALARVPEEVFKGYLQSRAEQGRIPHEAGALRFAVRSTARGSARDLKGRRRQRVADGVPPAMLDAVRRVLGDIDVCVGEAEVRCRCRLSADAASPAQLRGTVLVVDCRDPASLLPKLTALHTAKHVREAAVVLPVAPAERWFRSLFEQGWACCFTATEPPMLLAHLGHHYAFAIACREIGIVLGKLH